METCVGCARLLVRSKNVQLSPRYYFPLLEVTLSNSVVLRLLCVSLYVQQSMCLISLIPIDMTRNWNYHHLSLVLLQATISSTVVPWTWLGI